MTGSGDVVARLRGRRTRQPEIGADPVRNGGAGFEPPRAPITALGHAPAFVAGDAFAAIYRRHFDGVYRYCYRQLRDEQHAQDAAQQVFTNALEAFARYHEEGRLRQWLFTIAHNVIDSDRRKLRPTDSLDLAGEVPDREATPEERVVADAGRRELLEAIARLPEDQRRAIELRIQGKTGKEIAHELGRGHEAARMLLCRAMDRLRDDLRGHGGPKGDDRGH